MPVAIIFAVMSMSIPFVTKGSAASVWRVREYGSMPGTCAVLQAAHTAAIGCWSEVPTIEERRVGAPLLSAKMVQRAGDDSGSFVELSIYINKIPSAGRTSETTSLRETTRA